MGWRALLLLTVAYVAAEEEHFIDVKQIVKGRADLPVRFSPEADVSVLYQAYRSGTIEAVAKLPMAPNDTDKSEKPEEFYKLFQLPADIMTKLAADAGYIDHPHQQQQTTTSAPWIVRRKVHRSSEEEDAFTQDSEEEEEEERPRRKKKYHKRKDPNLIALSDLLPKLETTSQMPVAPLQSGPGSNSFNSPINIRPLPIVQSATDLSHSDVQPQYAYQPIMQPDGKTYYQQVLILPGRVVSSKEALTPQPRMDAGSFVQEKPRAVLQADYSVAPPTFPPPVDIFRRSPIPETPSPIMRSDTSTRNSAYPSRYVRPSTPSSSQVPTTPSTSVQVPQSDPIAITSSHQPLPTTFNLERQFMPQTQKESMFTTKLPSGEEQRIKARVFHEEAAPPPKIAVKATQASPLRIRSIDSRVETSTAIEVETRRRGEELRNVMEQHRQEVDSQPQPQKRKVKKVKKAKKLLKKSKSVDMDTEMGSEEERAAEEIRRAISNAPQTQYLERVPLLTPSGIGKQRAYASKTWKRRKYEPVDMYAPKDLQSFEEKTAVYEDATEPPKKRRKYRKSGNTKKSRYNMQSDAVDMIEGSQKEDFSKQGVQEPQQESPATSAPLKRKILRLTRYSETTEPTKSNSEERRGDSKPVRSKKLKRTKRVKKIKIQPSMSSDAVPLRAHCLNIRTFARQFGINDVEEFTREHCEFIENYYPSLTCDRKGDYVAECQKYY